MDKTRVFGLLMPISALPSDEGIGTLGRYAYRFVDFLKASGAGIWQVLPLVPTGYGDSPYQSCSAFAFNYYFIDLSTLVRGGLLTRDEVKSADLGSSPRRVDYGKQFRVKIPLLRKAFSRFDVNDRSFRNFVKSGLSADFSLFMALKSTFGYRPWSDWDYGYNRYSSYKADSFISDNNSEVLFWQFTQYIFVRQYMALKNYANKNGIKIMGDIPLYISYDSVEVWKHGSRLFELDKALQPTSVAGVPPDAFSDDGQMWGNPVYNWKYLAKSNYGWWNRRLRFNLKYYDILRIDHFRGFDRYYTIKAGEKTARHGEWRLGPGAALFKDKLDWNIVAEDLGVIDEGVHKMMAAVGYPGMKILEFAFDGNPKNEHKPTNYTENFVCYTGTHDNEPLRRYIECLSEERKKVYLKDLAAQCAAAGITMDGTDALSLTRTVVRLAFMTKAFAVIIPYWDVLAIGKEARFNLPATVSPDNWSYRFLKSDFAFSTAKDLNALAKASDRIQDKKS